MNQITLDFTAAKQQRDLGIQRCADANATWMDHALATLEGYLQCTESLRMEEFRSWWETVGGEAPKSHHAWGALALAAARRGLIAFVRFEPAHSVRTHGHPVRVYRSKLYRACA